MVISDRGDGGEVDISGDIVCSIVVGYSVRITNIMHLLFIFYMTPNAQKCHLPACLIR